MLRIAIGGNEYYDERENRIIEIPAKVVCLEHSLRSIAKWESKWNIPFLSNKEKTREQSVDYIRCMETTGRIDLSFMDLITPEQTKRVSEYINANMTATTITHRGGRKPSREIITAEILYYWMIQYGIPSEYDKWHLNRLLTLIEVCSIKSGPQQKMGHKEQMAQQRALNEARRAQFKTRG